MKRCTHRLNFYRLSCCLLAMALIASGVAFAGPTPQQKAEDTKAAPAADEGKETEAKKEEAKESKETKAAAKPAPATPATHTVKKGPFKIEVSLDGVFEAQEATELVLRPKAWATFKVLTVVEHGTRVKRGDLLVALDLEKIDRAIADLRRGHESADGALKLAEQLYKTLSKTTPMDLAAAERAHRAAQEDTEHYFKVSRAISIKSADQSLKSSQYYVENAEEELRQLEKMYGADDLTEETEEIILKRARRAVVTAKFYLEREKIDHQRTLKVLIPRRDVSNKESARRADFQLADSKLALPLALQKARMDLAKLKIDRKRSEEKLQHTIADRAAMTVKAPTAGVVYHGRFVKGKYGSSSSSSSTLREGSALTAKQVFMTVVKPRPMLIRTAVPEKQLQNVRAGIKGTAVPTGYSDLKLTAIVNQLAAIPTGAGSFDCRITVALDDQADALMPGMTCKVKLVSYFNENAVTVPPKALGTDEVDETKHYVYVVNKKGKSRKRPVTVGKRTTAKVEILKGLAEGDKILAEYPNHKKEEEKPKPKEEEKKKEE